MNTAMLFPQFSSKQFFQYLFIENEFYFSFISKFYRSENFQQPAYLNQFLKREETFSVGTKLQGVNKRAVTIRNVFSDTANEQAVKSWIYFCTGI